ncbi:MAG: helix-turn-helix transcriptional regulator [Lentisphaeria bacterium]|nr:helix-turn-helix transcriptional regulator [Lentisphaeria bacterium]
MLNKTKSAEIVEWALFAVGGRDALAERLGLDRARIEEYRTGKSFPKWHIFVRIAHLAGYVVTVGGIPAGETFWQTYFADNDNIGGFCRRSGANRNSINKWVAEGVIQLAAIVRVAEKAKMEIDVVKVR